MLQSIKNNFYVVVVVFPVGGKVFFWREGIANEKISGQWRQRPLKKSLTLIVSSKKLIKGDIIETLNF